MKNIIYSTVLALALVGCGGGGGTVSLGDDSSSNDNTTENKVEDNITTSDSTVTTKKIEDTTDATLNLDLTSKKDVYVIVTNANSNNIDVSINSNSAVAQENSYKVVSDIDSNKESKVLTPNNVLAFREKVQEKLKSTSYKSSNINYRLLTRYTNTEDSQSFYIDVFDSYGNSSTKIVDATAKKVVRNVETKYGTKTLVIWVEDDEYNDGSVYSSGRVTQEMVDNLADTFLKAGDSNDLYDWVTNVYGKEWGDDAKSLHNELIANSDYIDIIIDDMENDGIAGYFYSKDNFVRDVEDYSNEKIMFYINSRVYTREGYSDDDNEKEVLTTLAHEFHHMIHFYQRTVLKENAHPTWLNEMLSETTEDLVATKIGYRGPRNVDPSDGTAGASGNTGGRYPDFIVNLSAPLTVWNNRLSDYSKVSAFGTFLTRNYDGAKVLHDIEYSSKSGLEAVEDATSKNFDDLLSDWAIAVTLSDNDDTSVDIPRYNFGDFKYVDYNGITYELGSINFYNYEKDGQVGPKFETSANDESLDNTSNLYYHLGEVEGEVTVNVKNSERAGVTIIAK